MKLSDTKIHIGGLMRCCINTVYTLDPDGDYQDGEYDCKYEEPGNAQILLKDGVWQWNEARHGIKAEPEGSE